MRLTLYARFLLVLVPSFGLMMGIGLGALSRLDTRTGTDALALRVGNLSARQAGALGRHDALHQRRLAEDLLAAFGADGAVLCAELRPARPDRNAPAEPSAVQALATYPAVVGCKGVPDVYELTLPVGDEEAELLVRYTDAEVAAQAHQRMLLTLLIVTAALVVTLLSASIGFRLIVGRRLQQLHRSMSATSTPTPDTALAAGPHDELADIIDAYNALMRREHEHAAALLQHNRILADESQRDQLTGLHNRRHFEHWLRQSQADGRARHECDGLLALMDVDRFKSINDTHGHAVGDEVLVAIAQRLSRALRGSPMLVRWGGEEMLACLDGRQDAHRIGQRLLRAINHDPIETSSGPLAVTISIGLVHLPLRIDGASQALPIKEALVHADTALYQAKHTGRNRAVCVNAPTPAVTRMNCETGGAADNHRPSTHPETR